MTLPGLAHIQLTRAYTSTDIHIAISYVHCYVVF